MNNLIKIIIVIGMIAYIACPVDLMIGPIDDIIVALAGVAALKAQKKIED